MRVMVIRLCIRRLPRRRLSLVVVRVAQRRSVHPKSIGCRRVVRAVRGIGRVVQMRRIRSRFTAFGRAVGVAVATRGKHVLMVGRRRTVRLRLVIHVGRSSFRCFSTATFSTDAPVII